MQRIVDYFLGTCRIVLTGPWPTRSVNRLNAAGIPFWNLRTQADGVSFSVYRRNLRTVKELCEQDGGLVTSSILGFRHQFGGMKKRYALLILLPLVIAATLFFQKFIWVMEVQGNEVLAEEQILQALEQIGIKPGAYIRTIDGQSVKNHMLTFLPELEWISVNKKGGRATVLVQEREQKPEVSDPKLVSNVVASRAGVITGMQVYAGFPVVEVGDSVLAGEMLVSGLGSSWNAVVCRNAQADVFAYTGHATELMIPRQSEERDATETKDAKWSLIIGKKRWDFFSNAGISLTGYDKIESVYQWTLPGDVKLPICLVKTTFQRYDTVITDLSEEAAQQLLLKAEEDYVAAQLGAGTVLSRQSQMQSLDGVWHMYAVSAANEMIAKTQQIDPWSDEEFE